MAKVEAGHGTVLQYAAVVGDHGPGREVVDAAVDADEAPLRFDGRLGVGEGGVQLEAVLLGPIHDAPAARLAGQQEFALVELEPELQREQYPGRPLAPHQ